MNTFFSNVIKNLISVDLRTLGIFRIALGMMCLLDILRRFPYIEIFYSNNGVASNSFMAELTGRYSVKAFTIMSSLESVTDVTIFFIIALVFSFFLMIGYRTKLSHIITIITILSLHNRLIILENGADMVYNSILIWSVFLPLGRRFSIDRMLFTMRNHNDSTPEALNTGTLVSKNEPSRYWGLAYFAILLQLSIIYFFNYINKTGNTWEQGTSIYYFYHLDHFLTPFGNFIKEFGLMPIQLSKLLTYSTMYLEMLAPLLILIPFIVTRRIAFLMLVGFHFIIGISLNVGMFSWIMIASLLLLLSSRDMDLIKKCLRRFSTKKLLVFYDSDCGFCHQTSRIIRRFDIFNNITWAGRSYDGEKPDELESMSDETIVVWSKETDTVSTHHTAFSEILSALPMGFTVSWIFKVPGISHLSRCMYNQVARNRISISSFFGFSACDMPNEGQGCDMDFEMETPSSKRALMVVVEACKTVAVFTLILAALNYAMTKNDGYKDWREENGYKRIKIQKELNKISRRLRMTQQWNMFSPSTPRKVSNVVIEATLSDGTVIDLLTGKSPVYDKLDYYTFREIDHSQFWRKFLGRISKKNYKRYRPQLKSVLLSSKNPIKPFDDLNQDGKVDREDKIKSVELYKLSKSIPNPLSDSSTPIKVRKYKIDMDINSSTSKRKPIKNK